MPGNHPSAGTSLAPSPTSVGIGLEQPRALRSTILDGGSVDMAPTLICFGEYVRGSTSERLAAGRSGTVIRTASCLLLGTCHPPVPRRLSESLGPITRTLFCTHYI